MAATKVDSSESKFERLRNYLYKTSHFHGSILNDISVAKVVITRKGYVEGALFNTTALRLSEDSDV